MTADANAAHPAPSRAARRDTAIVLGFVHNEGNGMSLMVHLGEVQVDAAKLAELCRRYGVTELSLFGSAVRGDMGPESDIDIMVEFDPDARIGILKSEALAENLESLVGRRVDLVTKSGLIP